MDRLEELLVLGLVFGSVVLFFFGFRLLLGYLLEKGVFKRRLKDFSQEEELRPGPRRLISGLRTRLLNGMSALGHLVMAEGGETAGMRRSLPRAGYRQERAILIFWGSKILLAALLPALFVLAKILWLKTLPSLQLMLIAILAALAGFYLPNLWLRMKIRYRQEKIIEGLPDALDLLVVCTEAGIGLDAAIHRVGEEMKLSNPVISEEFKLLTLELRAGKERREALKDLAQRTNLEDVSSLVTLLIQTDRFGTSVAQALRIHSDSMRTKRYQRAEETAAKLPVKLLFPLIFFIFPSLFVVILGPAVIRIFRTLLPTLGGG